MRFRRYFAMGLVGAMAVSACSAAASPTPTGVAQSLAPGQTAAPWTPVFKDGKLQPLPDGFPNQNITLLNTDDPGAPDGIYARQWQIALQKVSPVSVAVTDRPDFGYTSGTWYGLAWQHETPGGDDGYILQITDIANGAIDILSTPVVKDLGASIDWLNPVAATEKTPWVLTQKKNAPWNSTKFQDMVDYVKAHPGEVKYICLTPGSGRDTSWTMYSQTLGLQFKQPMTCGDGSQGIASIIGAGAGDLALNTPDQALIGVQAGKMDVIFTTGANNPPASAPWVNVPIGASVIGPSDPWAVGRGFGVTKYVPELHRQWLYEWIKAASKDKTLIDSRTKLPGNILLDPVQTHDEALKIGTDAIKYARPVLEKAGVCIGC